MSSVKYIVREGDTEPINFTVNSAGSGADITGYSSVAMYLRSRDGLTSLDFSTGAGDFVVNAAATGQCSIVPTQTSFLRSKSQYTGYVMVVDGSGSRSSFPEDGEIIFTVIKRDSADT